MNNDVILCLQVQKGIHCCDKKDLYQSDKQYSGKTSCQTDNSFPDNEITYIFVISKNKVDGNSICAVKENVQKSYEIESAHSLAAKPIKR